MPEKTYDGAFLGVDYNGVEVGDKARVILEYAMKELKLKKLDVDPKLLYDIYSLFYSPALVMKAEQDVPDKDFYKIMETLVGSENLKALRKHTQLNSTESEWAAGQLLVDILKAMQQQQKKKGQQGQQGQQGEEQEQQDQDGEPQPGQGKQKEKKSDYKEDEMKGDLEEALKRLLEKMLQKKQEQEAKKGEKGKEQEKDKKGVKTLQGGDSGHTGLLRKNKRDAILEFAAKINVYEVLRRVKADLDTMNSKGTKYVPHSPGEKIDYEYGSDIERVEPTDLALPKDLILLKWTENSLLMRKEGLKADVGSLYVMIDRSGSMEDTVAGKKKLDTAEAIAAKLYIQAKKEHRDFYLRFFDTESYELVKAPKSQAGKELLVDYMTSVEDGGGTNISAAVQKALKDLKDMDSKHFKYIILITDGEDSVETQAKAIKAKMEEGNVKLITIMLGQYDNKTLMELSDAYLRLKADKNGTYILYKPDKLKENSYQGYASGIGAAMAIANQQRSFNSKEYN